MGNRTNTHRVFNKSEDGRGSGQGMSAEYEITVGRDGHHISPPGNPMKQNKQEEDRQDGGETN